MRTRAAVPIAVLAATVIGWYAHAQQAPQNESQIDVLGRFDGSVTLRPSAAGRAAAPAPAHVVVQNWTIRNDQTVTSLPSKGLLVMELRGGEITTEIDGVRTAREAGDFWVIPEGAKLILITGKDTATLQVTAIQ